MKEIGVGIIGVGFMGEKHVRLIAETQGTKLVGLADVNISRAKQVADQFQVERYTKDFEELLSYPELDAVIIATPEHLHRDPAVAAFEAGKDVFVEKPIATTLKDADSMIDASEKAKKNMMVGYVYRFDSRFAGLKDYVGSNAFGSPLSAYGKLNAPIQSGRYWGKQAHLELSFSVHLADLILWYFDDDAVQVISEHVNGTLSNEMGVPDFSWTMFKMKRGGTGVIECGWALPERWGGPKPNGMYSYPTSWYRAPDLSFEIIGTVGCATIDYHPQSIEACDSEGWKFPEMATWPMLHGRLSGSLREEMDYFLDCVRLTRNPMIDGRSAKKSLEIGLASIQSAKNGEKVKLPMPLQ